MIIAKIRNPRERLTYYSGTNTYLVGTGHRKVLIDCGDGQPGYVPLLIESLKSIHPEAYISDILISHCHIDHWGGLDQIMSSDELSHRRQKPQQEIKVHKFPVLDELALYKYTDPIPQYITITALLDNQLLEIDKDTHIRVVHTPGHAKDHCAFLLEEEDTVFTADCILGHGSVAFEDLTEYIGGLNRIKALNPVKLYPGHGEVVNDGMEKVEQYLSIRMTKENQILGIMKQDFSVYWTPIELAEQTSSASKGYSEQLMAVVVRTIGLHLIKLYVDGKVELVNYKKFIDATGLNPYDASNVFSVVNQRWKCTNFYMNSSKL